MPNVSKGRHVSLEPDDSSEPRLPQGHSFGERPTCSTDSGPQETQAIEAKQPPEPDESGTQEALVPAPPSHERAIEVTLKRGDTLFDILLKEGIPANRIHQLVESARCIHDLGRLRQGREFTLIYDSRDGRILRFETPLDGHHQLVVEPHGGSLVARKETFDYEVRYRVAHGEIHGSLFMAANAAGLPDSLIISLAEIFAWDIDFNVDIREGDSFRILFEEKFLDDCFARCGRILAARIMNRGRPSWAFYYEGGDGRRDYYDREARSLQKVFLKSPLQYSRISSRFSRRRLHPILKIYRPHLGVDYAAPVGTPVRAIGDGRITFVGWRGGYGRYIEIRHNSLHSSTYGHLHRYAKGIRKGRYVRQGQVIGSVGSTGLSTGPHLDFRLLKNGRFIDPLQVNYPSADPVREEDRVAYLGLVERLISQLEGEGSVLTQRADPLVVDR
jgi:murein DD-endopeptidase MepM/ murein hydrolase activator NlpD